MDKAKSRNRYRPFAEGLPALCGELLDRLWMSDALQEALSVGSCFDARKVVLTGQRRGLRRRAGGRAGLFGAMRYLFRRRGDGADGFQLFQQRRGHGHRRCRTRRWWWWPPSRRTTGRGPHAGDGGAGGGQQPAALRGGAERQAPLARSALCLGLDEAAPDFLPRAYLALTLALVCAGYRIARVRGTVSELELQRVRQALLDYTAAMSGCLEAAQAAAQDFAQRCGQRDRFDYIADAEARAAAHLLGTVGPHAGLPLRSERQRGVVPRQLLDGAAL